MKPACWLSLLLLVACAHEDGEPGSAERAGAAATKSHDAGSRSRADAFVDRTPDDEIPGACEKLDLNPQPNSPQVMIVLDRSGSMVGLGDTRNMGKDRWKPSVSALKALTRELTDTVAFGLMVFPATVGLSNGMGAPARPGCEIGKVDVPMATRSADKIAMVLDRSRPDVGATPTAASLTVARSSFACSDCRPAPKYVLLVTDGQPTCGAESGINSSDSDTRATLDAIDALQAADIRTYVIGYDTASDADAQSWMNTFAMHGGTERALPVEDEATLLAELTRVTGELVPCDYTLTGEIPDASYVRVAIDGVTYTFGSDWTFADRTIQLAPEGAACRKLRDAKLHTLKITRECERVILI